MKKNSLIIILLLVLPAIGAYYKIIDNKSDVANFLLSFSIIFLLIFVVYKIVNSKKVKV